jgi:alpha/beta superfamily hydrolase
VAQPDTRRLTFPCGDLSLEGALHFPAATPAPGVVVCHPHPQYGGDMENNVVLAACQALAGRGIVALRFNFRGAGHSQGAFDQGRGEQEDVRAALAHLSELPEVDAKRVGLIGYSFGATVAAEVADGHLRGFALVSPPIAFGDLRVDWGCPALVLGGEQDPIAPPDRLGVVGERPGVELRVISGADHSWWGFEDELAEALGEFFERQFQQTS